MRCYLFAAVMFASAAPGFLSAQTVKTPTEEATPDVAALNQKLDRQSQQLEALAREVSRLSSLIESRGEVGTDLPAPRPAPAATPPAPHPSVAPAPPVPPIEAPPGSAIHVVAKGENLTMIARKYGTTIEEIQKTNKIEDDRKLQIGQNLIVPTKPTVPGTGAAPSSTPSVSPTP